MSGRNAYRPYDELARKWCDLADRRRAHALDLYHSGRWRHYYNEADFLAHLRDVMKDAEDWARLAGITDRRDIMSEAAE